MLLPLAACRGQALLAPRRLRRCLPLPSPTYASKLLDATLSREFCWALPRKRSGAEALPAEQERDLQVSRRLVLVGEHSSAWMPCLRCMKSTDPWGSQGFKDAAQVRRRTAGGGSTHQPALPLSLLPVCEHVTWVRRALHSKQCREQGNKVQAGAGSAIRGERHKEEHNRKQSCSC